MISWMDNYRDVKDAFFKPTKPTVKFSIWRGSRDNLYPLFVKKEEIRQGDYIFTESENFDGFAVVTDFVKDEKGNISHWQLQSAGLSVDRENKMLTAVEKIINLALENGIKDTIVMISLKESLNA
jgi:hypothetical protein